MKREIERKFLVRTDALPALRAERATSMVQGYLAFAPSIRVRLTEARGETKAWLTIKGKGMLSRDEFEYEVPASDATSLLGLCAASLRKRRHLVEYEGHTWELDEFDGPHTGLWLAEIELESEDEPVSLPPWVSDEVTEDPRYTNAALARAGRAP